MKKEYIVFVEELRQALVMATGYEERRIYFKREEDYPQTKGDRLFVELVVGMNSREVCGLFVKELYSCYLNGTSINEMVIKILEELGRIQEAGVLDKAEELDNYEKIKDDLFIRLLNLEQNGEELKNCIYREIGDIALVLYMRMGSHDGVISSFKVHQDMVEKWNQSGEEVFEKALVNTYLLTPPRIYQFEKLIFEKDYCGDDFMDTNIDFYLNNGRIGDCLSTTERTNGAVAIFLPGVAERLGELIGNGYYIVFTNIHEVMIHNENSVDPKSLKMILKDTIDEATPVEDFLSFNVYHYDTEHREISMITMDDK